MEAATQMDPVCTRVAAGSAAGAAATIFCGCPSQRLTQALRQRRATTPPALQSAAPRPGKRRTAPPLRVRLGECDEYPSPVLAHAAGPELPVNSSELDVHMDTGQCGGYVEDADDAVAGALAVDLDLAEERRRAGPIEQRGA